MDEWVNRKTRLYLKRGGSVSRRKNVVKLKYVLNDIKRHTHNLTTADEIGKKHIYRFYDRHQHLSDRSLLNYFYVCKLLWRLLERDSLPPKPDRCRIDKGLAGSSGVDQTTINALVQTAFLAGMAAAQAEK